MFNFVFVVISALPLVGLIMMERGAYGPDIWEFGYSNGVSLAYGFHLAVMCATYALGFAILRRAWLPSVSARRRRGMPPIYDTGSFRSLAAWALAMNLALFGLVYFGAGASAVVAGAIDKGQFRSHLRFGFAAYLSRDFLSPMLSALTAYVYMRCAGVGMFDRLLLAANLLVTAAAGAIWGYRASMLMMLIPAFMMLVPRVTIAKATALLAGGFVAATAFATFYDRIDAETAANAVLTRGSVGVANATWRIWEIEKTAPQLVPPYAPTLGAAFGSRISALFGVDTKATLDVSNPQDYATLATLIAKNFSNGVDNTSNVTTGAFAEGVIAFGIPWFIWMSLMAGIVVAVNRTVLEFGLTHGRPLVAVLAANYFMVSTFSWLNSGGITVLFLVPYVVNYFITYLVARAMLRASGIQAAEMRSAWMENGKWKMVNRTVPDNPAPLSAID